MTRSAILLRRTVPVLIALAAVEAVLYLLLGRSAELHDLYRAPALIALGVGLMAAAMRLRVRHGGDRRHARSRRHEDLERGDESTAVSADRDAGPLARR